MQLKIKNNSQFNILITETEIKDYCGLKISKISLILIHLLNLKINTTGT